MNDKINVGLFVGEFEMTMPASYSHSTLHELMQIFNIWKYLLICEYINFD